MVNKKKRADVFIETSAHSLVHPMRTKPTILQENNGKKENKIILIFRYLKLHLFSYAFK